MKAEKMLDEIKESLYYEEITNFSKICQDELIQKREESDQSGCTFNFKTVSQQLQQMYTNQAENVINSIYYFWKISTQREEE